jgi:flagellar basal-body rod modification protein FlgD
MDISSATQTPQPGATASSGTGGTLIESDFDTFLVMLTTQLQNQDPLNPIESSDYAAQLATFSGVEQQVRTNKLLEGLADQLGLSGISAYASWIGREALSEAPVAFSGTPIDLDLKPVAGAEAAQLVVYDAQGREAGRLDLLPDQTSAVWSGEGFGGAALPSGRYSFKVEGFAAGASIGFSGAGAYAPVTEVRSKDGAPLLVLSGGIEIAPTAVSALRTPG